MHQETRPAVRSRCDGCRAHTRQIKGGAGRPLSNNLSSGLIGQSPNGAKEKVKCRTPGKVSIRYRARPWIRLMSLFTFSPPVGVCHRSPHMCSRIPKSKRTRSAFLSRLLGRSMCQVRSYFDVEASARTCGSQASSS